MLFEQPYTVVEGEVAQSIQLIDRLFTYDYILYRMNNSGNDELEQIKKVSDMLKEDGIMLVVSNQKEELHVVGQLFSEAGFVTTVANEYVCISKSDIQQNLPRNLTKDYLRRWMKKVELEGRVLEVNAKNSFIPSIIWEQKKQDGSIFSFVILKENKETEDRGLPYLMRQSIIYQEKVGRIQLNR